MRDFLTRNEIFCESSAPFCRANVYQIFFGGHGSLNYPSKLMQFLIFCVLQDNVVICALKKTCLIYFGLMKSEAFHEMALLI